MPDLSPRVPNRLVHSAHTPKLRDGRTCRANVEVVLDGPGKTRAVSFRQAIFQKPFPQAGTSKTSRKTASCHPNLIPFASERAFPLVMSW
jgi:hypothetical protein